MSTPINDPASPAQQDVPAAAAHEPSAAAPAAAAAPAPNGKTVQALVLDSGALIKNEPPVSTLLARANELYTIPAVLKEIRDAETRARVDTTLRSFLTLRSPKPESVKFVTAFARKTGDLEVLSVPDIHLLALTYELECEKNGGDWRLRNNPKQETINGKSPKATAASEPENTTQPGSQGPVSKESDDGTVLSTAAEAGPEVEVEPKAEAQAEVEADAEAQAEAEAEPPAEADVRAEVEAQAEAQTPAAPEPEVAENPNNAPPTGSSDSQVEQKLQGLSVEDNSDEEGGADSEGEWITPSNLKKHMRKDQGIANSNRATQRFFQAAIITSDYAMQNVALQINLNLMSSGMDRIGRIKSYVMRCHGCFFIAKDMKKQFCPRCGHDTLIRTSCSTDDNGVFRTYMKKNFQWNNRGNVYSIPKPTHGTSSGKISKVSGGGRNGWGQKLILAEDQKEYMRATEEKERTRQRDLMDQDYLPGILTGERTTNRRVKVGAGRNINSKKSKR